MEPRAQLALIDAALRDGRLSPGDLSALKHGTLERRRWLIARADARAESISETYARAALVDAGFRVVPQRADGDGGRVDLVVEGAVVVELDGRSYHSNAAAFAGDRARDRRFIVLGMPTLRYTFMDVIRDSQQIVTDVEAVLFRLGRLTSTVSNNLDRAARVSRPWDR
ncbi:hypothetical protein [Demequina sp.]|uniref:hypothetical protein n=1 Tax=Demequina sp. TaxID=2050685 RepID=UPI003A845C23